MKALSASVAFSFDRSFKVFSEEDQRAHLALFSHVPLDAEIEIIPVDRELNIDTKRVDTVYRVRDSNGERILHFEVVSYYDSRNLDAQYWYIHLLVAKYRAPVHSCLILLTKDRVPENLPPILKIAYGKFRGEAEIEIVRMWEIPAKEALALNRLAICPLVPLMDATIEDEKEAAHRIVESGRRDLAVTMVLLGGLRHGNKEEYLERFPMLEFSEEILKDSSYYKYLIEKGQEQGKAIGEAAGEARGKAIGEARGEAKMARLMLSDALHARFGPLPESVQARLTDAGPDVLRQWFLRSQSAPDIESVFS